jgi:hypothetical protein
MAASSEMLACNSTVGDLLIWQQNFERPRVGTPELLAPMMKRQQFQAETPRMHWASVSANIEGLSRSKAAAATMDLPAKCRDFPNHHFAIAVLCNEDNSVMGGRARVDVDALTNGIADI